MKNIKLDYSRTLDFLNKEDIAEKQKEAERCNQKLEDKSGKGSDFLGWVNLPSSITDEQLTDIENTAKKLKDKKIDFLIVIGIGGSYLGAKAVIEALSNSFVGLNSSDSPIVLFAGQNISEDYLFELKALIQNKEYALCVISKSGTTTEPAIAFRMLRAELEKKYGEDEAKERIIAVTDKCKGALRKLADANGYKTYVIPDDVGGRYSVLTPVGLVAIAVAGFDIRALVQGAQEMEKETAADIPFEKNIATQYAVVRNILYEKEYKIEILVNYHPKLQYLSEWWKQLYGESEGKEHKGIFPASANFTADLHSMGQYIQEGLRNIFETVITIEEPNSNLSIKKDNENLDGLNYLADKRIDEVNKMAELGTTIAHVDGGVPNLKIEVPKLNEYYIGQIIYFFERACGISGYLLEVNPFDQPGVEAYKSNMFALLEKPGYEEQTKKIKSKL